MLFDLAGTELAEAECAYGLSVPHPGWAEQDPDEVWRAVTQTLRALADTKSARPVALAVSSQSGTLIPARRDGTPIYPAITWLDGRSEEIIEQWAQNGDTTRIRKITGWNAHPGLPLATLAWLGRHNPQVARSAERWLCMNDYIVHRLSGQFFTNPSNAGVTQLVDASTGAWSAELCALVGAHPDQFSPIVRSGVLVGSLTAHAAQQTGLPSGIPVLNGGHDQSCTALALGVMDAGQALVACGTSWVITDVLEEGLVDHLPSALDLNPHVIPGRRTVSQSLGGLGAGLEWLVNQCWAELPARAERYRALTEALSATRAGSDGLFFLPLSGGHAAPAGMQRGGFINLQLGHTRAQLARAVMEGAVYELRLVLENIRHAGMPVNALWMVGGATRSAFWPRIVADATGLPVRLTESAHLPAVGAAILAGWGAGLFGDLTEAQSHFRLPCKAIDPDPAQVDLYNTRFAKYVEALDTVGQHE